MKRESNFFKFVFTTPVIVYSITLVLIPLLYILFLSFCKSDSYGGILYDFNIDNYLTIFNFTYLKVFFKSFLIGISTTLLCILIAYPFSLVLVTKSQKTQNIISKLIMVPFIANSLIRTYGWIVLLRKHGIINSFLMSFGLSDSPLNLMYNSFGIIIGMTYTLLPFMILPVYSSVLKMDKNLIEAGRDLGLSEFQIFRKIIFPCTLSGVFNGSLMVFIPAIGYFFITDILGGGKIMIIGNLIKNRFLTSRNGPFGASLSIFLIIITFILVWIYKKTGGKLDDLGGM